MINNNMLKTPLSRSLYALVKDAPVYDFRCRFSARDIYENRPFYDVAELIPGKGCGDLWLSVLSKDDINNASDGRERFTAFAKALSRAGFSRLRELTKLKLYRYFGITDELTGDTAGEIYERCNERMLDGSFTPRALLRRSNVAAAGLLHDPADSLVFFNRLAEDFSDVKIMPVFSAEELFDFKKGWRKYVKRLSEESGIKIKGLNTLERALEKRIADFCGAGCRMAAVSLLALPSHRGRKKDARAAVDKLLEGKKLTGKEYYALAEVLLRFLAGKFRENGMTMQLRPGISPFPCKLGKQLARIKKESGLPYTIIYSDDYSDDRRFIAACRYRRVRFCFRANVRERLEGLAEAGQLERFSGMVSDSFFFTDLVRHDSYRMTVCAMLADWAENEKLTCEEAERLAVRLCVKNSRRLFK